MPAPTATALIDAVDEADRVVGHVTRAAAPISGSGFRTVHVFVRDQARLLLQRLAPTRDRHPGRWGSSVAGYLHAGESYREAAQRREAEELGLTADLTEVGKIRFDEANAIKFVTLFRADAAEMAVRDYEHISELRWWSDAELAEAIGANPAEFTPTFVSLFEAFGIGDGGGRSR